MITPETLRAAAEEAKTGFVLHSSNLLEQAATAIAALTAENARLREALAKIASCEERFPGDTVSVARAALKGEPK